LFTLDYNFWTRKPSRSFKVSKDSDCSLVSNKNFSEILPSNCVGIGPGEVGRWPKNPSLVTSSQETRTPQAKKFFLSAIYKTCWVFWAFDRVCSTYQTGEILA